MILHTGLAHSEKVIEWLTNHYEFKIIQKEGIKKYAPIRLVDLDCHLADRMNDTLMDFTPDEVQDMFLKIVKDIENKVK